MTPLQREALQMCLEYIETDAHERRHVRWKINEALAQPAQPKYRRGDRLICLETEEYCVIHISGTDRQWVKFPTSYIGVYANEQVAELFELLPKEPEQEPAFHGFMDRENCTVNLCFTPWAPGGPNNELPTAYYASSQPTQPQQELEYCTDYHCAGDCGQPHNQEEMQEFLTSQPQQEPVAWVRWEWNRSGLKSLVFKKPEELSLAETATGVVYDPLYTSPPAQRKPLTDEEMYLAIRPLFRTDAFANAALELSKDEYQAIEAAHGIKENA